MTAIAFESIPIQETNEPVVDLSDYDFILAPMYFTQELSSSPQMFLRKSVADKLLHIQKQLTYQFKIWDGFRSRAVQNNIYKKFWKELHKNHPDWDEKKLAQEVAVFVTNASDPSRIPPHATGGAVDLTLVYRNGNELNMGTGFDYFGKEAASLYFEEHDLDDQVKANRKLLRESMIAAGFRSDNDEWWHFDYGNQIWALHYHKPFAIYAEVANG